MLVQRMQLPSMRNQLHWDFFSNYPFLSIDQDRVRTRAYFRWLKHLRTEVNSATIDWLDAEWEELCLSVSADLAFCQTRNSSIEEIVHFPDAYKPLASYDFKAGDIRPVYLGSRAPRICTLCQRPHPIAKFKHVAHVIPEALGNKVLKTFEECDDCNDLFGRQHDNQLAQYLLPDRALSRTLTKNGSAKLALDSNRSSIGGQAAGAPLEVIIQRQDSSIGIEYTNAQTIAITAPPLTFRPAGAMRSLARSMWHTLDRSQQARYDAIRRWIRGEIEHGQMRLFHAFMPGAEFDRYGIIVWESIVPSDLPLVSMTYSGHALLVMFWPAQFSDGNAKPVALVRPAWARSWR